MQASSLVKSHLRTVIIDAALIVLLCLTPALSHFFGVSYHYFEPMRIALFAGLLLVDDKRNGYLLAALLPVASMLISGMPTPPICALMVLELILNVFIFHLITKVSKSAFVGMLTGIVLSKVVFRLLKWGVISQGMMQTSELIANWQLQLIVAVVFATVFTIILRLKQK